MKPSHAFPLFLIGYAILVGFALVSASEFSQSGNWPPWRELLLQPSFLLTSIAFAIIGWWLGAYLAAPWGRMGMLAEEFRSDEKRKTDPILEVDEIVHEIEEGVRKLREAREQLSQAKLVLSHRSKKQEAELERSRNALLNILEDVEETNTRLKELDQFKNDFINITSHELRNPLTPIIAYLDALQNGTLGEMNEQQKSAVEVISRNSHRLKVLVSDILDISKLEGRRMKYFAESADIAELARACITDQESGAKMKNVTLVFQKIGDAPKVKCDRSRISQAITNYLTNAIKFSRSGSPVKVIVKKDDNEVEVSVVDVGIGIAKEEQKKLFTKFSQNASSLAQNRDGTGLGLAICKWIVEDHGGSVGLHSKKGRGSAFFLRLPIRFGPRSGNFFTPSGGTAALSPSAVGSGKEKG